MSTQNLNETNLPEWFEPFPEPQTMPAGWNLDGFVPEVDRAPEQGADDSSEAESDCL